MVDENYVSESLGWEFLFINMEQQKFGNTSGFTRESGPRELTAVATQCRVSMVQSGSHRGGLAWHYPAYFPFWFKRHVFVSQTSTRLFVFKGSAEKCRTDMFAKKG